MVLHEGGIVETGSHEELLARGGHYSRLYELQFKAQEQTELYPMQRPHASRENG